MNPMYRQRFLRSLGIFSELELEKLRAKTIAMAGLGLGGSVFLNLVRLGFEKFHIADPDTYERTNINRQRMAKETTIGQRKDDCLAREASEINPDVEIRFFREGVKPHNMDQFLNGVDWVVDVVDVFAMNDKLAVNQAAHAKGIPVLSCAAVGFAGTVVQFNRDTPSFAELTGIEPNLSYEENLQRFLQFITPEVPPYMEEQWYKALNKVSHFPFVPMGGELSAAFAASCLAKSILNMGKQVLAPKGLFIDSMDHKVVEFEASYRARTFFADRKKQKKAA